MNNNISIPSQNISISGTDFINQLQNLNIITFLNPENPQTLLQNLSLCDYLQYLLKQNQQQLDDNNQNANQIYYYFAYNNILNLALNNFQLNRRNIPEGNIQVNSDLNMSVPASQDVCFLNKKRNNSNLNEKENGIFNSEMNTNPNIIHTKDIDKITDSCNTDTTITKKFSNREIILKENCICKKENNSLFSQNYIIDEKEKIKKRKKRKEKFSELLKDSFLEQICKSNKTNKNLEKDISDINTKSKINTKNIKNKININSSSKKHNILNTNELSSYKEKLEEKPIKEKNKNVKLKSQHKKKQHKITIKNNNKILADLKKNKTESKPKSTKVIFHGENYKNTNSTIDFMKYNFDFSIEEQYKTKKLITDYNLQHIDMIKIDNFYENYNSNNQNLDEIEPKWLRDKFNGDNKELKNALNIIKDSFPGRKTDVDEEKCLDILKDNDYNIEEFLELKQ